MVKFLSDQNQLSFLYESGTYASTSGTRQWIGLVQEHTPTDNPNVIQVRYQGSTDRNVDTFADGQLDHTGAFTYFPQDWKFMGFAIGSIAETAAAGSHTFTETNSDNTIQTVTNQSLTSFTLEDTKNTGTAGSNFIRTYGGCMIDTYTVTWSQGDITSAEVNYIAQSESFTSGAITAVTPSTTSPYIFSNFQLHIPSGTNIDNVTECTLSINNNLEPGHYLNGSRQAQEMLPGNRDYEVSVTLVMDADNAKTFYDQYYMGGSTFNLMIKDICSAGSLYVVGSGCKVIDMETPSPVEGLQEQTLTIVPQHVSATVHDSTVDYNAW